MALTETVLDKEKNYEYWHVCAALVLRKEAFRKINK